MTKLYGGIGTAGPGPRQQRSAPLGLAPALRTHHRETYVAEMGARLNREIPADKPITFPVRAVLAGRRNNPPQPEINLPALAVYNPIRSFLKSGAGCRFPNGIRNF